MTSVFTVILAVYCGLLVALLVGWVRIRRQAMPARSASPPAISIVVAVRNEEGTIRTLLRDLGGMAFPRDRFEVIVVNDHSTDATKVQGAEFLTDNIRIVDLPPERNGKKEALEFGISQARFDIIATTDADCTISKNWLTCVASYFGNADTHLLIGAVKLMGDDSFFSQMQVTEFVSLTGSTAAAIGLGHPVMCNAANLAFRKDTFIELGGYEGNKSVASGDDEFLMRKILQRYPAGIRFLNYYEAVISSATLDTMKELIHQRLRWAGKWKQNSDGVAKLLAVFVVLAHVSFIVLLALWNKLPGISLTVLSAKIFLEGVFIFWVGRFLDREFNVVTFIAWQLLYPFYVVSIGIFSLFTDYTWKGRNYSGQSQG